VYFFTYSTWTSINGLFLEDLYVAAAWRRHGIARAIVTALTRVAHTAGCRRFQWLVLRSNQAAIRFYESLGAETADDWRSCSCPANTSSGWQQINHIILFTLILRVDQRCTIRADLLPDDLI